VNLDVICDVAFFGMTCKIYSSISLWMYHYWEWNSIFDVWLIFMKFLWLFKLNWDCTISAELLFYKIMQTRWASFSGIFSLDSQWKLVGWTTHSLVEKCLFAQLEDVFVGRVWQIMNIY